ncbi:MAG: glycosyltransferase family 2 protein [Verrucomicrobiia bacterium]
MLTARVATEVPAADRNNARGSLGASGAPQHSPRSPASTDSVESPREVCVPQACSGVFPSFAARTLVIIPAHNEEECVGDVVLRLQQRGFSRIRVVDNGSTDQTSRAAREAGAEVIQTAGRGYGLACWLGATSLPEGIEWLLFCNADASDDFDAYARFAELAETHDLILGSRTHPDDRRGMTLPQRFGNWLAPTLIGLLWGHHYSDLGPQRAIRTDAFQRLKMRDRGFGWTVEMQVRAVEEKLRIAEIPVRTFPRPAGQSKISGNLRGTLAAGAIILRTIAVLAGRKR